MDSFQSPVLSRLNSILDILLQGQKGLELSMFMSVMHRADFRQSTVARHCPSRESQAGLAHEHGASTSPRAPGALPERLRQLPGSCARRRSTDWAVCRPDSRPRGLAASQACAALPRCCGPFLVLHPLVGKPSLKPPAPQEPFRTRLRRGASSIGFALACVVIKLGCLSLSTVCVSR